MRRRAYLYTTTSALTLAIAGCSGSEDGGNGETEEPSDTAGGAETTTGAETTETDGETDDDEQTDDTVQGTLPSWADWFPAGAFEDPSVSGTALDVQRARTEFPRQAYEDFQIPQISEVYGIPEDDMDYFLVLSGVGADGVSAITGSFDQQAIMDHLDLRADQTETVDGFEVAGGDLAIGDSAVLVGASYDRMLDAEAGRADSLGSRDEDWRDLLVLVSDGALASVSKGSLSDPEESILDVDVAKSGMTIDAREGDGALLTAYLVFDSAEAATTAVENHRQNIEDEVTNSERTQTVQSIEQVGNRVVVTVETESFDF